MNVLVLSTQFYPDFVGGAERRYLSMAVAAKTRGHNVLVVASSREDGHKSGYVSGIDVSRCVIPGRVDLSGEVSVGIYSEFLRGIGFRPDIVLSNNGAMAVAASAVWTDVTLVVSLGEYQTIGRIKRCMRLVQRLKPLGFEVSRRLWERETVIERAFRRASIVAVGSDFEKHWITGGNTSGWPNLRVLPRGVVFDDWERARMIRQQDRANTSGLRVLVAARLEKCKNIQDVLFAVSRMRNCHLSVRIVGTGPEEKALRSLCHELQIPHLVEFAGFQPDMCAEYGNADVSVISSDHDSFPNTLLESLASGVPVVFRTIDPPKVRIGNYDVARESKACVFYDTYSPDSLASALHSLSQSPWELRSLSHIGVDFARSLDWVNVIDQYINVGNASANAGALVNR